jgi:Uma2 family endonuclease
MSALATRQSYYAVVERMPENTVVTFHDVSWQEYEKLLKRVGEASGRRISYNEGTMQVMTLSTEHEAYHRFLSRLISHLDFKLRIGIAFFGSATIKKKRRQKGKEPDSCFYVQTAPALGNRIKLDFEKDPPPDVAIEIDIHHETPNQLVIYAGLGVSEVWRYDGQQLTIHLLEHNHYVTAAVSRALPMVTSAALTEFLARYRQEGELEALLSFDEWLEAQPQ